MQILNLKKYSYKKRITINIAIRLLIIVLIMYSIIFLLTGKIKETRNNIITKKIEFEKSNTESQTYRILSQKIKEYEPKLKTLNQVFINQNRELEFITTLEDVANNNNISQTINLGKFTPNDSSEFITVPLELSAQGNYKDLINYVLSLESLNYYININTLSITNASGSFNERANTLTAPKNRITTEEPEEKSNLIMNINAETYWK